MKKKKLGFQGVEEAQKKEYGKRWIAGKLCSPPSKKEYLVRLPQIQEILFSQKAEASFKVMLYNKFPSA
jgi:hypothetical protein